jgi:antitoxin PrlF
MEAMKALVTSKGQVTIPKELRERFGIRPGTQVDFTSGRRWYPPSERELAGRSVTELLDELRGPVELPRRASRKRKRG